MRKLIAIVFITTILILNAAAPLVADDKIPASGTFTAALDFSTLSLSPVGANCLLRVDGVLTFTGTLNGEAVATTSALVLAPCADVAMSPPGTFQDVFKSELTFAGTVGEDPGLVEAHITYQGITKTGGAIQGRMLLNSGLKGNLEVDAVVAAGGTYQGFLRTD
jgi:hypothetical protein